MVEEKMRVEKKYLVRNLARIMATALLALGFTAMGLPAKAEAFRSIHVVGFTTGVSELNSTIRMRIASFVKKNPQFKQIHCIGFDDAVGSGESELGKARAQAVCSQATNTNSALKIANFRGLFDQSKSGLNLSRVIVVLSSKKAPVFTTTFHSNNGPRATALYKSSIGDAITLPSPTRDGLQFQGWFTKKSNGRLVGLGGERFVPRKNSSLWAGWISSAVASGGGGGSSPSTVGTIEALSMSQYSPNLSMLINVTGEGDFIRDFATQPKHFLWDYSISSFEAAPGSPPIKFFDCTFGSLEGGEYWFGQVDLDRTSDFDFSRFPDVTSVTASDPSVNFCATSSTNSTLQTDENGEPVDPFYRSYFNLHIWAESAGISGADLGDRERMPFTFRLGTSKGTYDVVLSRPYF